MPSCPVSRVLITLLVTGRHRYTFVCAKLCNAIGLQVGIVVARKRAGSVPAAMANLCLCKLFHWKIIFCSAVRFGLACGGDFVNKLKVLD